MVKSSAIRVIVIDDDQDIVDVFSDLLKIYHFNVVGIGYDGKDAVELYKKHIPDVVFLDINMPRYDGFYGLEGIRKINKNSIVIFITGDIFQHASKLNKIKPSAIYQKPFNLEDILEQINSLVEQKFPFPN